MFAEKLKQAMREMNIKASKLSEITKIPKSSISQYASGINEPSEARKYQIAEALGVTMDYFEDKSKVLLSAGQQKVLKLDAEDAARLLGTSVSTLKKGLRDGAFPWGYAVHTTETNYVYIINAKKFARIEEIDLNLTDYQIRR